MCHVPRCTYCHWLPSQAYAVQMLSDVCCHLHDCLRTNDHDACAAATAPICSQAGQAWPLNGRCCPHTDTVPPVCHHPGCTPCCLHDVTWSVHMHSRKAACSGSALNGVPRQSALLQLCASTCCSRCMGLASPSLERCIAVGLVEHLMQEARTANVNGRTCLSCSCLSLPSLAPGDGNIRLPARPDARIGTLEEHWVA